MKSILAFLLLILLVATPSSAQSPGMVEFTPVAGPYNSKQSEQSGPVFPGCVRVKGAPTPTCYSPIVPGAKTAPLLGGRVTVWLSRAFAVEGSLLGSPQAFDRPVFTSVRGVLSFAPHSRLWAYALAGPALVHSADGPGTDLGGVLGLGAHFRVAQSLSLRAEVERYIGATDQLDAHNNVFLTLGLSVGIRHGNRNEEPSIVAP